MRLSNKNVPPDALLRLKQIIGDPRADPPMAPLIPVSRSTWYAGIIAGRFPRGRKLGERTVVWSAADIRQILEGRDNWK